MSSGTPYRSALFLAVLVMSLGAATAHAQSIEDARGLWFDADFEASRDGFTAVLESPSLTAADALDAHRYLAVLALVLRDEAAARRHADAAVALSLDVTPPEGAPTASVDLFRMARRRLGARPAELVVGSDAPLRHGVRGVVVARMERAPAGLVASIRIRCGDVEADGPLPSVTIALEPAGDVTCTATARTAAGAVLYTEHRELEVSGTPAVASAPQGEPAADEDAHPRRARRIAIISTVLALAAAGAVTGVVVHGRRDDDARFGGTTVVGW